MPNIITVYDGSDRTQDISGVSAIRGTGSVTSATDQKYTGPRSLKITTNLANEFADFYNLLADAGRRISFRIRFEALDTAFTRTFVELNDTSDNACLALAYNTSDKLVLRNPDTGLVIQTGTTVLSTGTWYRVAVSYTITTTTSWACKIYLNGSLEISATNADPNGTLPRTGSNRLAISCRYNVGSSNWVDDLYVDDGTDLNDPGDYRIPFFSSGLVGAGPIF